MDEVVCAGLDVDVKVREAGDVAVVEVCCEDNEVEESKFVRECEKEQVLEGPTGVMLNSRWR